MRWPVTVSGVAPVVKLQTKLLASALPARSLAPVVIVARLVGLGAGVASGVIVKASIASLKAAAIFWLMATPVAALAGTVKLTVGAVVSGVAPVVKLQTKLLASALPARSLAPVVIVAV